VACIRLVMMMKIIKLVVVFLVMVLKFGFPEVSTSGFFLPSLETKRDLLL